MKNVLDTLEDPMYKIMAYPYSDDYYQRPTRSCYLNYLSKQEADEEMKEFRDDGEHFVQEFIPQPPTIRQLKVLIHLNNVGYDSVANCQRAAGLKVTECGSRARDWWRRGWMDYEHESNPRSNNRKVWMVYLKWVTKYKERFGQLPSDELIAAVAAGDYRDL